MATAKTKAQLTAEAKKKQAAVKAVPIVAERRATDAPADVAVINLQHLTHIVTQTTGPAGFCYAANEVTAPLVAAGFVEVKADMADEHGALATRATQAGIAYVAATPFVAPAPVAATPFVAPAPVAAVFAPVVAVPAVASPAAVLQAAATRTMTKPPEGGFKIVANVPLPAVTRGFGPKASIYPFALLEVGQSFFVPATEARPNPAKAMASTVNSAAARFMVEDGVDEAGQPKFKKTRTFALRNAEDGAPWGSPGVKGAAIFRTA